MAKKSTVKTEQAAREQAWQKKRDADQKEIEKSRNSRIRLDALRREKAEQYKLRKLSRKNSMIRKLVEENKDLKSSLRASKKPVGRPPKTAESGSSKG